MLNKNFTSICIITFFAGILFTNCNNTATSTMLSNKDTLPKIPFKETGIEGSFSTQTKLTFDSTVIQSFLDSFPKFKTFEKTLLLFTKPENMLTHGTMVMV